MAFLVRNTHRTFSAIFKKTLENSRAQLLVGNGITKLSVSFVQIRVFIFDCKTKLSELKIK